MRVSSPPRPPNDPVTHDELEALVEALIEEARQRARRRRKRYAAAALFVVAGLGSAAMLIGGSGGPAAVSANASSPSSASPAQASARAPHVRNGPLTVAEGNRIVAVDRRGVRHPIFRCSAPSGSRFCSTMEGFAWSPTGDKLLFSSTTVTIASRYSGMHVLDLNTGKTKRAGSEGYSPDWSRDGRIAIVHPEAFLDPVGWILIRRINRPVVTDTVLKTGTEGFDSSPSWSPDGDRLVFATRKVGLSTISIIDSDGSHRRLLARHASSPTWSPDGRVIAYRSPCGVKLITPRGADVTPANGSGCRSLGVRGVPHWSPDGTRIAIATPQSVYVMGRAGKLVSFIRLSSFGAWYRGPAADVSWQPIAK